jgi:hypothetical protein
MGQDPGFQAPAGAAAVPSGASLSAFQPISASTRTTVPQRSKKSPAPFVYAASHEIRREFYEAYRWFVATYRTATDKLSSGRPDSQLPGGQLPGGQLFALPFVAV